MAKLSEEQVKKIARLCKIKLTDNEVDKFSEQITSILEYVHKINEVETENITYKSQVDLVNVMDADAPEKCLDAKEAVRQSEYKNGQYFTVPKVITD